MVAFNTLKVGDVLYSVERQKMGNTSMTRQAVFRVTVAEIDAEHKRARCSWNGNPPRWYSERGIKRLRRSKPKKKVSPLEEAMTIPPEPGRSDGIQPNWVMKTLAYDRLTEEQRSRWVWEILGDVATGRKADRDY